MAQKYIIITARRYVSAVYAVISVRPSVCLSKVGALQRWLNLGSRKQRRTIAQGLYLSNGITPNWGAK